MMAENSKPKIGLEHIPGSGAFVGIPARDLTVGEVQIFGGKVFLIETGLYREPTKPKPEASSSKPKPGPTENK